MHIIFPTFLSSNLFYPISLFDKLIIWFPFPFLIMNKRSKISNQLVQSSQITDIISLKQYSSLKSLKSLNELSIKQIANSSLAFSNQLSICQPKQSAHFLAQNYLNKENVPPIESYAKKINKVGFCNFHKENEKYKANENNRTKHKSIYDQYRQRIDKGINVVDSNQRKNSSIKLLRSQNQELKNQMLSDLDRLRLVRQKSQKSLKRSQSVSKMQVEELGKTMEPCQLKKQAIEKNRQKLARIK